MDNTKYWENRVNRLIRARLTQIDRIFKEATEEAARIGAALDVNTDKAFSFADYPATKKRVDELMKEVHDNLQSAVVNGIDGAWKIANDKEDEFCKAVFSGRTLTQAQKMRYFNHSDKAREAFALRKSDGLSLSDRVWRYTNQFKQEIEMGLDIGIGEGRSAADMARDLKRYLREPDKLFRRVRDKRGNLQLSKNAAAYHPGAGVYRSSYKNALRLTRTETNMAYRTADQMRYQSLDFVVGIEIHTSNNHPVTDICDELKGKYPKNFKFVGWHPQCRCYVTSILKTEKEINADTDKLLAGKPVNGKSINEVKDMPLNFKSWVGKNKERIKAAEKRDKLPYFIKDNRDIVESLLSPAINFAGLATLDKAGVANIARTKCPISTQAKKLKDLGFTVHNIEADDYDFDVLSIATQLKSALGNKFKKYLGNVFIYKDKLKFDFTCDTTLGQIFCQRIVYNTGGVKHSLLVIPEKLQGKGLSKALFRAQYESYRKAGIKKMAVGANINVGGYCWASYGFCAKDASNILKTLSLNRSKLTKQEWDEAENIVKNFYKKHTKDEYFPMNLLSSTQFGHRLLNMSAWDGVLNLEDPVQRAVFESYLFG